MQMAAQAQRPIKADLVLPKDAELQEAASQTLELVGRFQ